MIVLHIVFLVLAYVIGAYAGADIEKRKTGKELVEIDTELYKLKTVMTDILKRNAKNESGFGQIPKLQSYSSSLLNKIEKLEGKYSDLERRIERVEHISDNNEDDIIFIHDFLNVEKVGEIDKYLLGSGVTPERAVTYKLVKNK